MEVINFPRLRGVSNSLLGSLLEEIENGWQGVNSARLRTPAVTSLRSKDGYRVAIELPGVKKDGLDINVGRGLLSIKAVRPPLFGENAADKGREYNYQLHLGDDVSAEEIDANYEDGLLILSLRPKKEQELRKVSVN